MQNSRPSCPSLTSLLLCVLFFLAWGFILIRKYVYFGYDDWDLAYFNQAMWNLSRGSDYVSLFDIRFWANHSNLIALVLLPFYVVFQHPLTLVFFKVLSFAGAGYGLYLIGRPQFGERLSLLVMLLFFVYPPNFFAILYEFDFESLFPVFGICLFYFFVQKKLLPFTLMMFLTILIKENMPLIIMAFGVYALFLKREKKWLWVLTPFLTGLISFYFLTYVFIPHFREGGGLPYIGYYKSFGNSPFEVIFNIISKPWQLLPYLWTPVNQNLIFELFSPLMFLPFLSPHILFLISPVLLQHLLSYARTEHMIYYQYASSLSPFIFIAAIYSLAFLKRHMRSSFFYFLLTLIIAGSGLSIQSNKALFRQRNNYKADYLHSFRWDFIREIPRGASVVATFDYLAELSNRKYLYAFHKLYHSDFQRKDYRFRVPAHVSYALIDFNDGWLVNHFYRNPQMARHIYDFFSEGGWTVKKAAENIVLFAKGTGTKLVEVSDSSNYNTSPVIDIDGRFGLMAPDSYRRKSKPNSLIPLTFDWESYAEIKDFYTMLLILKRDGRPVLKCGRIPGYFVYPTNFWRKGDHIKERYWLYIPEVPAGRYTLEVAFVNNTVSQMGLLTTDSPDKRTSYPLAELIIDEN